MQAGDRPGAFLGHRRSALDNCGHRRGHGHAAFFDPQAGTAMTRIKLLAVLCLALVATAWAQAPQRLQRVELQAGMHRVQAQVASSPEERALGLMHVRSLPQHEGMLFVFERNEPQCFWMRNTLLPLSIAFLRDDGSIVNIKEMQALDDKTNHCSAEPVRYALEMNAGWFAKRGMKAGSKLAGAPFAGDAR